MNDVAPAESFVNLFRPKPQPKLQKPKPTCEECINYVSCPQVVWRKNQGLGVCWLFE